MSEIVDIWVELAEEESRDGDIGEQYCNAVIRFGSGESVGINVWSEQFFKDCTDKLDWLCDGAACGPDLVVRDFSSQSIKFVLRDLVEQGWLVGRGFPEIEKTGELGANQVENDDLSL